MCSAYSRSEAYAYFHHCVLMRLARDPPPSTKPRRRLGRLDEAPLSALPPLDLTAYNTLLHYALRHRLDLALANQLLCHMRKLPKPLEPDIVTFNILIRSGTLLRRFDIAEHTLVSLRRRAENAQHGIMVTHDSPRPAQTMDYIEPALSGTCSSSLNFLQCDSSVAKGEIGFDDRALDISRPPHGRWLHPFKLHHAFNIHRSSPCRRRYPLLRFYQNLLSLITHLGD